jgi:hypothetical protein
VGGAALSWFMFSLNFTLLYLVTFVVMSLGGSCASGGPYEIAVQCPDNVALFAPLSIFGGLAAVGVSIALAQGFGTPLTTWAWPVLFVGLGSAFLLAFIFGHDLIGLIIGTMFVLMGLAPLVLELRGSPQRVFLGQFTAGGKQFFEGDRARRSLLSPTAVNPEAAVIPTLAHWALSLGITVVAAAAGYLTAVAWFTPAGPR